MKDQRATMNKILHSKFNEKLQKMNFMSQKIFVDMFSLNQMFQSLLESIEEGEETTMVKLIKTMDGLKAALTESKDKIPRLSPVWG